MKPAVFMLKWKFNRVTSGSCGGCSAGCLQEPQLTPGVSCPPCPRLSPGVTLARSSAGERGGVLPSPRGAHGEPQPCVQPATVIRQGQMGRRGRFPDPFRETEVPCHRYRRGAAGPSPAHAGSRMGCLEPSVTSVIAGNGASGGGTAAAPWPLLSPMQCKAPGRGGLRGSGDPPRLPTSHAACPRSGPTASPQLPGKQKAFTFVGTQKQESLRGKEKEK